MTTERELQDALDRRGDGGGRGGAGADMGDGGGGRLIGFLKDLDLALAEFGAELRQVPYPITVEGQAWTPDDLHSWSELGADLAATDTRPKLKMLIRDLDANYLLREPSLAAHGLTGDPLLYKTIAGERRRKSLGEGLKDLAARFRDWQRYFDVASAIFGSLLSALKEIPGMSALIDAIKEMLEFLAFNAEEIAENY